MILLSKFIFKTKKKSKINLIKDSGEMLNSDLLLGSHTEIFSNKKVIIDGCLGIIEYQNNLIKLKLKKGFLTLNGTDFLVLSFDKVKIDIKGNIQSLEFCL